MSVTSGDVRTRLGAPEEASVEVARVTTLAQTLVTQYVDSQAAEYGIEVEPPEEALDEAVLRVAVDLYNRAQAPNGVLMTAYDNAGDGSSTPIRLARDPLWSARDVLAPYVPAVGGFA